MSEAPPLHPTEIDLHMVQAGPCVCAVRSQAFFAELALEVRKPHYGGPAREFAQSILLRAQERGLYTPEKP